MACFKASLCPLDDTKVAIRTGTECLKRLLVSLTFVRCNSGVKTVEFDNNCPLLQSGFVGLNLAREPGQKTPAERLNGWPC